ncbi:MAG: BMP family ABC transporter substrate-binding protein [Clostridia bacterium]
MRRFTWMLALAVILLAVSCAGKDTGPDLKSVAVFVPGVASGSPIYEMLVQGATEAVAAVPGARMKVVEGGFDQSTWLGSLRDIASSGEFGLIVTSNPALPELAAKIVADFPDIRFFIADAYLDGNSSIHTVLYNQMEQGYLVGYLAGLVTKERSPDVAPVAGLIAAHRYPTLDQLIRPGFEAGLKAVDPAFVLEYREVGNWYDANKAAELAEGLYASGVEVILPIAGGAGQGVVAAARERGRSVVWFDGGGYALGPDTVIGCATLAQDELVAGRVKDILGGKVPLFGKADIVSAADGYIGFDPDGDGYRSLPAEVRGLFETALAELKAGRPDFTITSF